MRTYHLTLRTKTGLLRKRK